MAALGALALLAAPAQAMPVKVDGGRIEGQVANGLRIYKGVPFAEPPVGELRWRAPRPVKAWSGVRRAANFAPACMQTGVSMPGETPPAVSEDCLYLNVWTPAKGAGDRLPVLVWIPGGGFSNGSASMPLYWGDRLAKEGAVVVTVGYRVGPLGFLAHPELTAESPHRSSGNYGLEDQIAALRWVRRNIAAFGGDPGRVTIAGQSAGAISVSILMASPLARGLFHRAIGQSGGLFEPLQLAPSYQLSNAEREGVAYATSVGARSLAELRRLPATALLQGKAGLISHPVIEPNVLPASPYEVFASGRQHDVPILIGSNADEARSLTVLTEVKAATFADDIAKRWGPLPPEIIAAYPNATDEEARTARAAFERDLRFGWDMWAWARLRPSAGQGHDELLDQLRSIRRPQRAGIA
jgi:para-nitrobenzyl esterase